ncbi:MAG: glycosyl transferase [Planctomycetota bacterium]|nr:glycosyl transferase [Planctomycetota bacterium]
MEPGSRGVPPLAMSRSPFGAKTTIRIASEAPADRVSALILARDEAENLPDCLASLAWADERIVVVDASSKDASEILARRLADRVIVRAFDEFASQRNAALDVASGRWVFAVDADERSSPEQGREIRSRIGDARFSGYRVPIRSEVLGRPFRFSGTQHDRPLRLFRRDSGRWTGAVHETVNLRGVAGELNHALRHRTLPDMKSFLSKIDAYTTLEARKFAAEGRPVRASDLTLRPVWTFAKLYLGKQGFRDGLEGFLFCALSGMSVAVRHWKHREMLKSGGVA